MFQMSFCRFYVLVCISCLLVACVVACVLYVLQVLPPPVGRPGSLGEGAPHPLVLPYHRLVVALKDGTQGWARAPVVGDHEAVLPPCHWLPHHLLQGVLPGHIPSPGFQL